MDGQATYRGVLARYDRWRSAGPPAASRVRKGGRGAPASIGAALGYLWIGSLMAAARLADLVWRNAAPSDRSSGSTASRRSSEPAARERANAPKTSR